MELVSVAIIVGDGDLVDGNAVLEALEQGVTHFVEGIDTEEAESVEAASGYEWERE